MADDPRDPGWGSLLQPRAGGLVLLRTVFVAFLIVLVVVLVGLSFVDVDEPLLGTGPAVAILAVVGAMSVSIAGLLKRRLLRGRTSAEVASSYGISMFALLAVAEAVVIVGVVLFLFTGTFAIYLVALVFAAPAYALAAPTRGDITRQQEILNQRGVNADLLGGLLDTSA
ncbi:MAG: hypothetical protein WD184_02285 [Acidimicrobiia bacterium]